MRTYDLLIDHESGGPPLALSYLLVRHVQNGQNVGRLCPGHCLIKKSVALADNNLLFSLSLSFYASFG